MRKLLGWFYHHP